MNILLTSVGRRSYLVDYFKEALQGKGKVIATNTIADTPGMFASDISEVVPPANEPGFIDALLDICRQNDVKILCSLHDWEAPYIASHKNRFLAEGIIPVVPESQIVDMCLDKFKTCQFANTIGVPTPLCFIEVEKAIEAIDSGKVCYPLILKPRWGQGSISMRKAHSNDELILMYRLIYSEITNSGFSYLAGNDLGNQVLIQQFISGREYGVDIVNDFNGDFAACFIKYKFSMRSGETDAAETVSIPEIEIFAHKISKATRHLGNLDADFFISDDGVVYLLELNPRFGGGYPFSHMAGSNIPAALIAWAEGREPDPNWLKINIGIRSYKDIRLVRA